MWETSGEPSPTYVGRRGATSALGGLPTRELIHHLVGWVIPSVP